MRRVLIAVVLVAAAVAYADTQLYNRGTKVGPVSAIDCRGSLSCSRSGNKAVLTVTVDGGTPFSLGVVPVADGGTGLTSSTEDAVLVGSGTATWSKKVLPGCNATTQKLIYNTSTNSFSCATDRDADSLGSYTFGGYSAPDYAALTPIAHYKARHDGYPATIHFTVTGAGSTGSGTGTVEIIEESSGLVICDVAVSCSASVGTEVSDVCEIDKIWNSVRAGETYRLRWASGSCSDKTPGGNTTFVVDEDVP